MIRRGVVFRIADTALGAVPVEHVVETMRALPVVPIAGAPAFVLGAAVVRGKPVPVVEVARLVGEASRPAARWMTVRVGPRVVALAVQEVVGVRALDADVARTPPLLSKAMRGAASEILSLDGELLVVLESAYLLGEDVWTSLERPEKAG